MTWASPCLRGLLEISFLSLQVEAELTNDTVSPSPQSAFLSPDWRPQATDTDVRKGPSACSSFAPCSHASSRARTGALLGLPHAAFPTESGGSLGRMLVPHSSKAAAAITWDAAWPGRPSRGWSLEGAISLRQLSCRKAWPLKIYILSL